MNASSVMRAPPSLAADYDDPFAELSASMNIDAPSLPSPLEYGTGAVEALGGGANRNSRGSIGGCTSPTSTAADVAESADKSKLMKPTTADKNKADAVDDDTEATHESDSSQGAPEEEQQSEEEEDSAANVDEDDEDAASPPSEASSNDDKAEQAADDGTDDAAEGK